MVAAVPGSTRGETSRSRWIGTDESFVMFLRSESGLRKPMDWSRDLCDIVTTFGRAELTLSMGEVVRGEVRDGDALMCL